jgi:nucleolin
MKGRDCCDACGLVGMNQDSCKLFVAGLSDTATEDLLRALFGSIGATVVEISLPRDRATGRLRGFGFVTLGSEAEVNKACGELDGTLQQGRPISVRRFRAESARQDGSRQDGGRFEGNRGGFGGQQGAGAAGGGWDGPRPERNFDRGPGEGAPGGFRPGPRPGGAGASAPDRTLYVGNLPYDATEQDVRECLGEGVDSIHLPMDQVTGRPRGFGFANMKSAEAAAAVVELAGAGIALRGRRLVINLKGDRPPPRAPREGGYGGGGFGGGGYGGGGHGGGGDSQGPQGSGGFRPSGFDGGGFGGGSSAPRGAGVSAPPGRSAAPAGKKRGTEKEDDGAGRKRGGGARGGERGGWRGDVESWDDD